MKNALINLTNCTKFCTIHTGGIIMDDIMPISEVRANLPSIIDKISASKKPLVITRNGKPAAILLSPEEMETLEIKSDPSLLRSILSQS